MTETTGFNKQDGVSLKEFLCDKIVSGDKLLCLKIESVENKAEAIRDLNQLAVDKAVETTKTHLATLNEFRNSQKDLMATYMPKATHETYEKNVNDKFVTINARVDDLKSLSDIAQGKASQTALLFTMGVSLIGIILGLLNYFGG